MELGIWTPLPHTVPPPGLLPEAFDVGPTAPGRDPYLRLALDVIRRADEFGFDVTLVAERFMGPDAEAWILATTLAAHTSRITVMPAVHPGILAPQIVAKLAATLHQVSGGRSALNIVNGWAEAEFQNFSNGQWLPDSEARYRRMTEFLEVLRRLWTEDEVTHRGEFYSLDEAYLGPKPVDGLPAIFGASGSDAGRDALARYGDVWFLGRPTMSARESDARFDEEIEHIAREISAMRRRAAGFGRTIRCGLVSMVVVGEDEQETRSVHDALDDYARRGTIESISVGGLPVFGTPVQIEKRIRALDAAGVDLLMLKFAPMRTGLERFGVEVLPLIQDLRR